MEIIKKAATGPHKFKVLKSFGWSMGKVLQPGEEIEISNSGEQLGYCQTGRVIPADMPEVGEYVALTAITLPGVTEKFTCKKMELIKLKSGQALPLLLEGKIIPKDGSQWRPNCRQLKK